MADLIPIPFSTLVTRMMREITQCNSVYNFPLGKCFTGSPGHDLSVQFHGNRASTPLGPAAGPHTQMAQNIVLCWLGGSRIIELKTVQVLDQLTIARPCIDMRTVGYNIEWSQELPIEQSGIEYVKAMMLIEILKHVLNKHFVNGFTDTIYDMSLGYDLAGIQSESIRTFINVLKSPSNLIEVLRSSIPQDYAFLRDIEYPMTLSKSATISTFHGCPPEQIDQIAKHLISEHQLNVVIKLNPILLGCDKIDYYLHDVMGYHDIQVPDSAYSDELEWADAIDLVRGISDFANTSDISFGIKLTNTLVVTHDDDYLPESESHKFLSGRPLHILAITLVKQFRNMFGADLPISFSAGIDKNNFKDAVALGLIPVTVCTDFLRPGGYARAAGYFKLLLKQMDKHGVSNIDSYIKCYSCNADIDFHSTHRNYRNHYKDQI